MPTAMKNMITDTYLQLLERRNIDKITVKDLVDACGISRQTFYYHFRDIFEVIDWSFERKMQQVLKQSLEQPTKEQAIRIFVEAAVESHAAIKRGLASQKREHIEAVFLQALNTYLLTIFRKKAPRVFIDPAEEDVVVQFCSGGIAHLLLTHCKSENTDIDQLTQQLCRLLTAARATLES